MTTHIGHSAMMTCQGLADQTFFEQLYLAWQRGFLRICGDPLEQDIQTVVERRA